MKFSSLLLNTFCLMAGSFQDVTAFHSSTSAPLLVQSPRFVVQNQQPQFSVTAVSPRQSLFKSLHMSSSPEAEANPQHDGNSVLGTDSITSEELQFLEDTFAKLVDDSKALTEQLIESLPTMPPSLIIKLKQQTDSSDDGNNTIVKAVATALNDLMDAQMEGARDLLKDLLEAGEIRKMDALIGKAARTGKLDAAFFTVLNMNLQAAAQEAVADADTTEADASRVQILQHVYTRCQEEVEKTIPPGTALLNKLLRTEIDSIRSNQLNHYLCPQPKTITSPDGQEIELKGGVDVVLVAPTLLIDAIGAAVKQIRTVEQAGGTNREAAAGMVESCRQVAKEARMALAEHYGGDSSEVTDFEAGLQPVFRPESPDSVYMKGE